MSIEERFNVFLKDYDRSFLGWNFSYIEKPGRVSSSPLPWSYGSLVLPKIRSIKTLLDMGTGGGELLSCLAPLPEQTYATELYKPNISVAKSRLSKYGVSVIVPNNEDDLPFQENFFDLIINRHEYYNENEVKRVLKQGKYFITQQVGNKDMEDFNQFMGSPISEEDWNVKIAKNRLENAGFKIELAKENFGYQRFYDIFESYPLANRRFLN